MHYSSISSIVLAAVSERRFVDRAARAAAASRRRSMTLSAHGVGDCARTALHIAARSWLRTMTRDAAPQPGLSEWAARSRRRSAGGAPVRALIRSSGWPRAFADARTKTRAPSRGWRLVVSRPPFIVEVVKYLGSRFAAGIARTTLQSVLTLALRLPLIPVLRGFRRAQFSARPVRGAPRTLWLTSGSALTRAPDRRPMRSAAISPKRFASICRP